jgi:hypothetical protein
MPFAWQQQIRGLDFAGMERWARLTHDYLYKEFRPFPFGQFLTSPKAVLSIDLGTATAADLPQRIGYSRPSTSNGILDGFCVYFDACFDDELLFTSSPAQPATNWAIPFLRVAPRRVRCGDVIELDLKASNLAVPSTWGWDLYPTGRPNPGDRISSGSMDTVV